MKIEGLNCFIRTVQGPSAATSEKKKNSHELREKDIDALKLVEPQ